jgi:uncharacterized protein (TIGR03083 family)
MAILELIADERRKTADLIEGLDDAQLGTQSLCGEWSVHDVAAHLLMPLVTSVRTLAAAMLRAGGNFDKANIKLTASIAKLPARELAAGLRENATDPFKPPGFPHDAPLTDLVIHGQDMRRPLGIDYRPDDDKLLAALNFIPTKYAQRAFVRKGALDGLRLEASDIDWSSGDGELVRGPATSLLMTVAGRPSVGEDVEGEGLATLLGRLR